MSDPQLLDGLIPGLIGAMVAVVALKIASMANKKAADANKIAKDALEQSKRSAAAAEGANQIATDALAVGKREATAAETSNRIANDALEEASQSRQLQEEQAHLHAKPELTLELGDVPGVNGWIPLHLRCEAAFESATIAFVEDEAARKQFAGLGPGPSSPHQQDFSDSITLPATSAGRTVTRGLWVFHAEEIEGVTIRLLCTITKTTGATPWEYLKMIEFPVTPQVWGA